jgi:CHAD domain-containing protein
MADQGLRAGRSGTSEVRRLARQSMKNAHRMLSADVLTDAVVHEARKEIRKSRATVRLLRVALGGPRFRRENARLRDVGRALNGARDARVLVHTLDVLRRQQPDLGQDRAVAQLSRRLRAQQQQAKRQLRSPTAPVAIARRTLAQTQFSAGHWPVADAGWDDALGPAFRRLYAAGRQAVRRSRARPDDHALHEWRKQAKYLRHVLQVLTPLRPAKLSRHEKLARRLVDRLGDGHDLALLRQSALASMGPGAAGASGGPLLAAIDRRRRDLRKEAFALAEQVYAESPRELDRRLRRYWHRWSGPVK